MDTILQFLCEIIFSSPTITIDGYEVTTQLGIAPIVIMGISAAISALASGITAGVGAAKNKKSQKILDDLKSENEQRYLQEMHRGALDNDGARAYLKRLDSEMEKRDKALENSVVATGATHENALAQKQANNEVMSDAIAGLVEREDARKSDVENRYINTKASLAQGQINQNAAVANNWAQLGQGISSAAGSLASAYMMDGNLIGTNPPANPYSRNPYWNNKLNNLM